MNESVARLLFPKGLYGPDDGRQAGIIQRERIILTSGKFLLRRTVLRRMKMLVDHTADQLLQSIL